MPNHFPRDEERLAGGGRSEVSDRQLSGGDPAAQSYGGVDHRLVQQRRQDAAVRDAGVPLMFRAGLKVGLGASFGTGKHGLQAGIVVGAANEAVPIRLDCQRTG